MSEQHSALEALIVQLLREVQMIAGWLPRDTLMTIAEALRLSLADVEGVAGFQRFFHTRPVGRTRILFSNNITDRMPDSEALLADLCARLDVAPEQTSADGLVVETYCTVARSRLVKDLAQIGVNVSRKIVASQRTSRHRQHTTGV